MREFATLITELDQTNKTNAKISAFVKFFKEAPDEDKLWAIALLNGKRPKRTVNSTQLSTWATEAGNIPDWLFAESYNVVGFLSETIAVYMITGHIHPAILLKGKQSKVSGWNVFTFQRNMLCFLHLAALLEIRK
jgi:hypothetical protein